MLWGRLGFGSAALGRKAGTWVGAWFPGVRADHGNGWLSLSFSRWEISLLHGVILQMKTPESQRAQIPLPCFTRLGTEHRSWLSSSRPGKAPARVARISFLCWPKWVRACPNSNSLTQPSWGGCSVQRAEQGLGVPEWSPSLATGLL